MSNSKAMINVVFQVVTIGFLALTAASYSHAQDRDRVDRLEKEIQAVKIRLADLESSLGASNTKQTPLVPGEGWKSLANWRQLKIGMSPSDVRALLGEPSRIEGGELSRWFYQSDRARGHVLFVSDKLYQWAEPN